MVRLLLPRDVESLPDAFAAVGALCREHPEAESARLVLELVMEELFTNLVRHNRGGGPLVVLELEAVDGVVTLRLIDQNVEAFDARVLKPLDPGTPLSERREGGLGLRLVHTLCEDLAYDYEDGTVTVTAIKRL